MTKQQVLDACSAAEMYINDSSDGDPESLEEKLIEGLANVRMQIEAMFPKPL